jgi:hypothetical protein
MNNSTFQNLIDESNILIRTKEKWKIYGCVVHVAWTDGNLQIFDLAHEQAK